MSTERTQSELLAAIKWQREPLTPAAMLLIGLAIGLSPCLLLVGRIFA